MLMNNLNIMALAPACAHRAWRISAFPTGRGNAIFPLCSEVEFHTSFE